MNSCTASHGSSSGYDSCEVDEKSPLIVTDSAVSSIFMPHKPVPVQPRPLARRWYILLVYSLLTFTQSTVWNTWGPIAQSAKIVFPHWTDGTIALLSAWGSITYLIFMVPLCWLLNAKGLRWAIVTTGLLQLIGTGMRCIRLNNICIHAGQFLNGIAGVILSASPSMLAAVWFPPNERTTAVAIACQTSSLGVAVAFVLGTLVVQSPSSNSTGLTDFPIANVTVIEDDIIRLMDWEFFATFFLVCCIVFYFSARPPCPPSHSASVTRSSFKAGVARLMRSRDFLLIMFSYGIALSIFGCWTSVMDLTLEKIGISQDKAGWLGFYMTIVGSIGSVVVARVSDLIGRKLKSIMLGFLFVELTCYVLFILIVYGVVQASLPFLYTILIVMSLSVQSLNPLYLELAAEVAYPVDESVIVGTLSGMWNLIGTVFLLLFFIPDIGVLWMNWCLLLSALIAVPLLWHVKESYQRSMVDVEGVASGCEDELEASVS